MFGAKLRCKTLVLRKDKVTQCVTRPGWVAGSKAIGFSQVRARVKNPDAVPSPVSERSRCIL